MKKISLILLFFILHIPLVAEINYSTITGYKKIDNKFSFPDTISKGISQKLAAETYGILEKEINPDKYIVGVQDEFTVILPIGISNAEHPNKFKMRVSPDGNLLIDGVGSVYVANKTLNEAYKLITDKLNKIYKNAVVALTDIRKFKVSLSGPGVKSCIVAATAADRVSEVIERAGGLNDTASVRNIILVRNEGKERKRVDLLKYYLLGNDSLNPFLLGGDQIIVPLHSAYNTISIQGDIPAPNEVEFCEGDSLSDLIRIGLGFFESAALDSIEYVQFSNSGISTKILNLSNWKNILFSSQNPAENFALNSGDRIYVRKKANWPKTYYVTIEGEVQYPGKYAIQKDSTKIYDLIQLAGGFTKEADLRNIEFIRQDELKRKDLDMERLSKTPLSEMTQSEARYYQARVREKRGGITINFEKATTDKNSIDNIILISQDSIIVPSKKDVVGIQGKVIKPGLIKYQEGYNYMDYINAAGGFADRADEGETTVNKASGEQFLASKTKKYKIEPGDNIVIPPKSEISWLEVVTTILTIASPIISIIAVIISTTK